MGGGDGSSSDDMCVSEFAGLNANWFSAMYLYPFGFLVVPLRSGQSGSSLFDLTRYSVRHFSCSTCLHINLDTCSPLLNQSRQMMH